MPLTMDEVYERRKDIFFTNLLLLGFDISYMEKKYGISFNKDMFNVPNQKAFEVVTHFLFTKLNEVTKDEYKILWPVLDKMQEREFMKTCKMHLTKISKENSELVHFPHVGQILMSPGGSHKFYELYMAFSSYVMQRIIAKDKVCHQLCRPTLNVDNQKDVKEILELSTIISTKEFTETQRRAVDCHNEWHETAQNFVSYYRKTKRQIFEKQKLFKDILDSLIISNDDAKLSDEEKFQAAFAKSGELLQEVTHTWHNLEDTMKKEKSFWEIIKCGLDTECVEKITLDGHKYISPIPDVLKKECRKELLEQGVQSLVEGDKLSLRSFLNLCHVNMKFYERLFNEAGLPDLDGVKICVESCINKVESISEHTRNLSKNVSHDVLPDITEEKISLERSACNCVSKRDIESINEKLPPTHPMLSSVSNERTCLNNFEYVLQLSPKSERKFLESCPQRREFQQTKAAPFTNDSINPSEIKLVHRLSRLGIPTPSQPRTIPKSFFRLTHELSHPIPISNDIDSESVFMQKENLNPLGNVESDSLLLYCDLEQSVTGSLPHDVSVPPNHFKTFSAPNSFEISPDINANCLDRVQKKFVQHLVNNYKKKNSEVMSSDDDSFVFPCSTNTDLMGATAFHNNDVLVRTPPSAANASSELKLSTEEISNLSQGLSKGSQVSQDSDIENYRRVSWPSEDDFLENVTLPDIPILL